MYEEYTELSQSQLLERGWTKKMIELLLPKPRLIENKKYPYGYPIKLWELEDIEKAEQTKEYKELYEKKLSRKEATDKAIETKRKKADDLLEKHIKGIEVELIDKELLEKETIECKQGWYEYIDGLHNRSYTQYPRNALNPNKKTLQRWEVNYIRHNLTSYDEDLYEGKGMVGRYENKVKYKTAVLDKIAELYPFLAKECERQKKLNEDPFSELY